MVCIRKFGIFFYNLFEYFDEDVVEFSKNERNFEMIDVDFLFFLDVDIENEYLEGDMVFEDLFLERGDNEC